MYFSKVSKMYNVVYKAVLVYSALSLWVANAINPCESLARVVRVAPGVVRAETLGGLTSL